MNNGSTWNRWELHMHTPFTKKEDQFNILKDEKEKYTDLKLKENPEYKYDQFEHKWDKYISKINNYVSNDSFERNIKVLGITDYWSIDNYEHLVSIKNKLSSKIELILPNVELRLSISGKKSPINIHCIFNPEIVDELREVFFAQINMETGDGTYYATKNSFIKLGKKICKDKSRSDNDYEKIGIKNFTVELSTLQTVFKNHRLRENTIIVVANSTNDGASGLTGQLEPVKKRLYHFVDAIFSATPSDIKYFSGKKSLKNVIDDCGKAMPCFHGSDAHSYEKIFEPDEKRYCYIKSELSFDGLKQVLNDPLDRVFIGKTSEILENIEKTKSKKIKTLSINNSNTKTWFRNVCIEFNPQLNVIIGNKGNGKTAIGDILALCSNVPLTNDFKFLSQFSKTQDAQNIKSKITFFNEVSTEEIKLSEIPKPQTQKIKYIPQSFFESITNEIDKTDKFRKEIEEVIFDYFPSAVRQAYSTFSQYRETIESLKQGDIEQLCNSLFKINKEIVNLEDLSSNYSVEILENDLKNREEELAEHVSNKPKCNSTDYLYGDSDNELETLNEFKRKLLRKIKFKKKLEEKVSSLIIENDHIHRINIRLNQKVQDISDYFNSNKEILTKYDLEEVLKIEYDGKRLDFVENKLQKKIDKINNYLERPYLPETNYADASLKGKIKIISSTIENLESKVSDRNAELLLEQEKIKNWEKIKKEIEGEDNSPKEGSIKYLKAKLNYIEKDIPKKLEDICNKRLDIVNLILSCKLEVADRLGEGTKDLKEFLSENDGTLLSIESELSLKNDFVDRFLANINQQKSSSYQGILAGREVLNNLLDVHFSNKITEDEVRNFLLDIDKTTKEHERRGEKVSTDLSFITNREELYNYLYSLDYMNVEFNLKMGNKPLNKLSPGERGAVLLVFYLLLDKEDIPLVIDQPEDNLDNQSIADILVPFIRKAKKRRQIIMITHNPNLAILSDTELVIHVAIDKKNQNLFSYTSGGIENRQINKEIQDILEGTPRAFRIRDNKYFGPPSDN